MNKPNKPKFYSRITGTMRESVKPSERMSSAELAEYLKSRKPNDTSVVCPVCEAYKQREYKTCRKCFLKLRKDVVLETARKHHEKLAEAAKLPRKNRTKSRIINSLISPKNLRK